MVMCIKKAQGCEAVAARSCNCEDYTPAIVNYRFVRDVVVVVVGILARMCTAYRQRVGLSLESGVCVFCG